MAKDKPSLLILWHGPTTTVSTIGFPLRETEEGSGLLHTKVRHKGMFASWIPVTNIPSHQVSDPRQLRVSNKLQKFSVVDIYMDFDTGRPTMPPWPVHMNLRHAQARKEARFWENKYRGEKQSSRSIGHPELIRKEALDQLDFAGKARRKMFTAQDQFSRTPYNRGGMTDF